MPDWSPFGYAYSNPVSFIDFMGLAPTDPPDSTQPSNSGCDGCVDGGDLPTATVTASRIDRSDSSGGASWKVNGQSTSQKEVFDLIDRRPSLQSTILSGGFDTEYNQPIATAYMKHDVTRAITEFNSNFALVLMTVTPIGEGAGVLLSGYSRLAGRVLTTGDGFLLGGVTLKTPINIPVQRFGNMSTTRPDYWGARLGTGKFVNRTFVAIKPEWNPLSLYTTGVIPKGTSIRFGLIGPQGLRHPGGAFQFVVDSRSVLHQSSKIIPR